MKDATGAVIGAYFDAWLPLVPNEAALGRGTNAFTGTPRSPVPRRPPRFFFEGVHSPFVAVCLWS